MPSSRGFPDPGIEPRSPALQQTLHHLRHQGNTVVFDSLQPHGLYSPWNAPGQYTGVGCHFLLQGIFPTQRSNPICYVSCIAREILYH